MSVGGALLLSGLTLGPVLLLIEKKGLKILAGLLAFMFLPTLTYFFYRMISGLVWG
ncbi:MAG: hypothetical protein OEY85_10295 [Rhodospirillales bacterium]|nr:hypothetical protein [Rhodospirillales bacterium]